MDIEIFGIPLVLIILWVFILVRPYFRSQKNEKIEKEPVNESRGFFGAEGIRNAVEKSYRKHVKKCKGKRLYDSTTPHQLGLYGALASRYLAGFKSVPEVLIWAELAPFLNLNPTKGLKALSEYIVYKEMPAEADKTYLTYQIRRGLSLCDDEEEYKNIALFAKAKEFTWSEFLGDSE